MSSPPVSRCRHRPRPLDPHALRPTDLLAAFFVSGIAFLLAAAVAGVLGATGALADGRWLALHLAFLGGVSQLILGAGQFFVAAFLATDPPPRRLVRAQLAVWGAGTVLVAVGVPTGTHPLVDVGGLLVLCGLALFGAALWRLERRSLQTARWAVRWYYACAACLGIGALAGIAMARGVGWSSGSLLGAHLALNLAGWMGTAIVGTLHTFFPSLTHTRLARPRLQPPAFAAWCVGVGALAAGEAFAVPALVWVGWGGLALGALLLLVNVAACARRAPDRLGLAPRLVGAGQGFLLAGLVLAVAAMAADGVEAPLSGDARAALAVLLLAGWIGLTVAGSLIHLLSVLHRVRHLARAMPEPRVALDNAVVALAAGGVALLALSRASGLDALAPPGTVVVLAAAALLGARVLALAAGALRSARIRI